MDNGPVVKTIDIETAPILADVWNVWQQNVGKPQIHRRSYIMSYVSKVLGEDEVSYMDGRDTPFEDFDVTYGLRDELDEADFVVGHNFNKFDLSRIRGRVAIHGIPPFSPIKVIDTLTACRKFGFPDNRLETMLEEFDIPVKKSKHRRFEGHEMWKQCISGNMDAWDEMVDYNIVDVVGNELLYERIKPYIDNHPSFGIFGAEAHEGKVFCGFCGSEDIIKYGYRYTNLSKFRQYKCNCCGKYPRGRTNLLDLETRQGMTARVT